MSGEPQLDGPQAGRLGKGQEGMNQALAGLKEHLHDMQQAGAMVQRIKEDVSHNYRANSSTTHCAAIDDWLAIHRRITQATENFHQGTDMTDKAMTHAEDTANSYALALSPNMGVGR
ncbi:hypothetical protein AB0I49_21820 [Streptomyces sp. NPDC050617]|uniref:hypothetical protein n=1 Tax=Streptomyces sp. NPDC050617 TaxID=3154628 RepID=UPI00343F35C7